METAAPHELAGFLPGRATPDLGGGTLERGATEFTVEDVALTALHQFAHIPRARWVRQIQITRDHRLADVKRP